MFYWHDCEKEGVLIEVCVPKLSLRSKLGSELTEHYGLIEEWMSKF